MEELLKHALGFGIELTCHFPRKLPPALADSHQLELALLMLALDARDAMTAGGRLTISASEELHAADTPDPRLPAGRYMRIRIVSTAVAAAGPGTSTETLLSTEVDGDNCNALSAIRMMLDQSSGAVHSERRVNAGTTVELWLPEAFPGRRDRSFGPGYALPELHD